MVNAAGCATTKSILCLLGCLDYLRNLQLDWLSVGAKTAGGKAKATKLKAGGGDADAAKSAKANGGMDLGR